MLLRRNWNWFKIVPFNQNFRGYVIPSAFLRNHDRFRWAFKHQHQRNRHIISENLQIFISLFILMQMNNLSFKSACCGSRMFYQERKSSEALPMWFCNTRTPGQHQNHLLVVTPIITIIPTMIIIPNTITIITIFQIPDGLTTGDVRATIQPTLASIHTLFLKYFLEIFSLNWNLAENAESRSFVILMFINNLFLPLVRNFPREHNRIVRATRQVVWQEIKKAKLKLKEIVLGIRAEELTFQARILSWEFSTHFLCFQHFFGSFQHIFWGFNTVLGVFNTFLCFQHIFPRLPDSWLGHSFRTLSTGWFWL